MLNLLNSGERLLQELVRELRSHERLAYVTLLNGGSCFAIRLEGDKTTCYLNLLLAMHMELVLNMQIRRRFACITTFPVM
jgi:hypothetical protein